MKIFLAGTSNVKNQEMVFDSPYILESYYYIQPWQDELIKTRKMFLLDSGAFTFFSSGKSIDWNKYLDGYVSFINEHGIEHFIELDIDDIIGFENVLKLRKKLEDRTGKQCMPVWHINRGKDEYIRMCKDYSYIAIGGLVGTERRSKRQQMLEQSFPWFINTAHENGAQIHALGYTKIKELPKYHFDSVDSTSWRSQRYGRIEYFDGKTIKRIDGTKSRKKIKDELYWQVNEFSFKEWLKFQKYADNHL